MEQKQQANKEIEQDSEWKEVRDTVRKMLYEKVSDYNEWIFYLYCEGYFIPPKFNYGFNINEYKDIRQMNLKKRKQRWKILRLSIENRYLPIGLTFMPGARKMIFDFRFCNQPYESYLQMYLMILNYCDYYNIYQYSPLPNTGYKYYSGERIIIYYMTDDLNKQQKKRLSQAIQKKLVNGYELKNTFQIIIKFGKWEGKLTNSNDWKYCIIYDNIDVKQSILINWKQKQSTVELFKECNLLKYCRKRGIQPWPFHFKEFNLSNSNIFT